jgi:hypothetical protein
MVERIHIVRAPFVRRSKDKIYLSCLAMATVFYISITVISFIYRVTELRPSDGRCHFGIREIASFPTLAANLFTNLVLTGIFFYLLRPVVKVHSAHSIPAPTVPTTKPKFWGPRPNESAVQRNIRTLLWKSIFASLLLEIPLAANMIQFIITKGEELGMICLVICMVDGMSLRSFQIVRQLTRSSVLGLYGSVLVDFWFISGRRTLFNAFPGFLQRHTSEAKRCLESHRKGCNQKHRSYQGP